MRKYLLSLAVLLLAGCNPSSVIEKFADTEKLAVARAYLQKLMNGDHVALATELDASLRSGNELSQFKAMRDLIPPGTAVTTEVIGYYVNYASGATTYSVSYQYGYGGKWIVANVVWRESTGTPRVLMGMHITPFAQSLQEINAFNLKRAGATHYLFLAAAILIPSFIVVTLIVCIRTKMPRQKWLWVIFILVGVVQYSINWTTGETMVKPVFFQLLGAGMISSGVYSPWIISISFPLGAIVFWVKRRELSKTAQAAVPPAAGQ